MPGLHASHNTSSRLHTARATPSAIVVVILSDAWPLSISPCSTPSESTGATPVRCSFMCPWPRGCCPQPRGQGRDQGEGGAKRTITMYGRKSAATDMTDQSDQAHSLTRTLSGCTHVSPLRTDETSTTRPLHCQTNSLWQTSCCMSIQWCKRVKLQQRDACHNGCGQDEAATIHA